MKLNNKKEKVSKEETTMRNKILNIVMLMAVTFLIGLAAPGTSQAVNTAAGTSISNDVELTYYVGGVLQTTQNLAAPYTFAVDNKVDLTVVKTGDASVPPGSTDQAVAFTVTNTGNSTQRYALAEEQGAFTFSVTSPDIYIDLGVIGTYEAGTDVLYGDASTAGDVVAGGTINVLIVGDTPIGATNGQTDIHNLLATTVNAGTLVVTAESVGDDADPDVIDVVFAETSAGPHSGDVSAEDGQASASATYTVASVTLTISKSSTVISDPINLLVNPIAIPGAVVQYSITVTHSAGASDATNVTISDDLSTEIANGTLAINAQHSGGVCTATEGTRVTIAGVGPTCNSNAADGDEGDITGNIVTATGITLQAAESAVLTFEVTIQ